ncbi:MAG: alginate export family protein [Polyangiales bacterium]
MNLHEGFVAFRNKHFEFRFGRFEMAYGDELVIGSVGWNPTGRSFDAFRLRVTPNDTAAFVDAFFSVIGEGAKPKFGGGDVYFAGTYAALGPLFSKSMDIDAYILGQFRVAYSDATTTVAKLARITIGSRIKNTIGAFDYRAEAALQTGRNADATILAGQVDAEIGLKVGKFRGSLEGAFASGDNPNSSKDEAYDQLYPTAHKWLGLSDIIGARSNVASGILHAAFSPSDVWKIYADGHVFFRPQDIVRNDGMTVSVTESGYFGSEVDLGAIYTIGPGLKARVGYALFIPSDDAYATKKPAHFLEVEIRYDRL